MAADVESGVTVVPRAEGRPRAPICRSSSLVKHDREGFINYSRRAPVAILRYVKAPLIGI